MCSKAEFGIPLFRLCSCSFLSLSRRDTRAGEVYKPLLQPLPSSSIHHTSFTLFQNRTADWAVLHFSKRSCETMDGCATPPLPLFAAKHREQLGHVFKDGFAISPCFCSCYACLADGIPRRTVYIDLLTSTSSVLYTTTPVTGLQNDPKTLACLVLLFLKTYTS
jgi:hypothetical protein